ncbi:MAG: serine/threonine protein phosphatase, partial [Oscillospiraceae bacterium]|nr:serine/threonine protein phosphatase [Oscillospiraceae bacterium]
MNVIKRLMSRRADLSMNFSGSAVSSGRFSAGGVNLLTLQPSGVEEHRLYDNLRYSVPIVDAALQKIIRLTGGFKVKCSDPRW